MGLGLLPVLYTRYTCKYTTLGDERFKPVVGCFCERHGLTFVNDGSAGTLALAAAVDVDEADVEEADARLALLYICCQVRIT